MSVKQRQETQKMSNNSLTIENETTASRQRFSAKRFLKKCFEISIKNLIGYSVLLEHIFCVIGVLLNQIVF